TRRQKAHGSRNLVRRPETGLRNLSNKLLPHVIRKSREHVGIDESWTNRIHRNVILTGFQSHRLGQAYDPSLGRSIVSLSNVPGLPDDRANVDDAAVIALTHPV